MKISDAIEAAKKAGSTKIRRARWEGAMVNAYVDFSHNSNASCPERHLAHEDWEPIIAKVKVESVLTAQPLNQLEFMMIVANLGADFTEAYNKLKGKKIKVTIEEL